MTGLPWDVVVANWLEASQNYGRVTSAVLVGQTCHYCGDVAQTIDHVIPRVLGGSDDPSNLVPACRSCNGAKSGHPLMEWAGLLRREVARAEKRRRALQVVETMLAEGLQSNPDVDAELDAIMDRVPMPKAA